MLEVRMAAGRACLLYADVALTVLRGAADAWKRKGFAGFCGLWCLKRAGLHGEHGYCMPM